MVAPHVNLQGQVYAKASDMVLLVEQYLLYTKKVRVRIAPLRDQEDIRKLGIAYDHACKYFGLINPFYTQESPAHQTISQWESILNWDTHVKDMWSNVQTPNDNA